ncbi:MAG TPA: serine protease inhibitor ecotin [Arsenophonus nasoniae]|uniref:serine protease inhibitor ecotin n=1 Tax=Arsenophonus nasoniae TaxID=638 RepID=UPI003879725E
MNKYTFPLLAMILTAPYAMANDNLTKIAPYPTAEKDMHRYVIQLAKKENENNFMVELVIGKSMLVDCNHHWFGGDFEKKELKGWGYDYYELKKVSGPAATLMACPDKQQTKKFITTHLGDGNIVRYNSKLPIVVYVPKDMEVKYRIWSAPEKLNSAEIK